MKKLPISILLLAFMIAFASCERQTDNQDALETEDLDEDTEVLDTGPDGAGDQAIRLSPTTFEEFPNASLTLNEPKDGANLESGDIRFSFNVQNYQLGAQSNQPDTLNLANSDKGQHIHLIVDNDPYTAHYEPVFNHELSEGNHVVLAFLSRSFHASVKNEDAYILNSYTVGNTEEQMDFDKDAPHMFYSRPKGTYTGEDTKQILLDFYLVNTSLSADGNRVRATINDREFMIDEWQPYIIENLPMGENTIKLELIDVNKNLIESPFNPVTRTITLEEAENL